MISSSAHDASKMETELRQRERRHAELVQQVQKLRSEVNGLQNVVKDRDVHIQKLKGTIQSKDDRMDQLLKEKESVASTNESLKTKVSALTLEAQKDQEDFIRKMSDQHACVERLFVAYKIQEDGIESAKQLLQGTPAAALPGALRGGVENVPSGSANTKDTPAIAEVLREKSIIQQKYEGLKIKYEQLQLDLKVEKKERAEQYLEYQRVVKYAAAMDEWAANIEQNERDAATTVAEITEEAP